MYGRVSKGNAKFITEHRKHVHKHTVKPTKCIECTPNPIYNPTRNTTTGTDINIQYIQLLSQLRLFLREFLRVPEVLVKCPAEYVER